ncbi:glycoside hydrolase family 18 protein [Amylocystis lapponica]|nr:glycoside hydrolase family 18 protein [Amylocystis lapponica]
MLSTSPSRILFAFALAILVSVGVLAAPSCSLSTDVEPRDIVPRATIPSAPRFVIYSDKYVSGGVPNASDVQGYNVFALSFLLTSGSADQAQTWEELTSDQRSSLKAQYVAAGISLIVSAFGSTETPTSSGVDAASVANTMAAWVKQYDLDGIDVDYEDFNAMNGGTGSAEKWLTTFTQTIRDQLPQGQYIVSHAPVAPWFSKNSQFSAGAYLTVDKNVGDLIDWYNVQFYNQGTSEYTTCDGLLTNSSGSFPDSALFQIAAAGPTLDKLLIGKPATGSDASNGYIDPNTLAGCVEQAKNQNWDAGVMVWEFPDAAAAWIKTVRSQAFAE